MENPPTEIAIAIVESQGRFLVGVRAADAVLAGYDEFPGGKVRSGESSAQAARRECLEETGLDVVVDEPVLPPIEHEYAHGPVRLYFFRCRLQQDSDGRPQPPFRWLTATELAEARFPEANRTVIHALLSQHQAAPA